MEQAAGHPGPSHVVQEGKGPKKLKPLKGTLTADHERIGLINTYREPRMVTLFLQVVEEEGQPVADAYVAWSATVGTISKDASTRTESDGLAQAFFYSHRVGESVIHARVTKPGYETIELSVKVEVVPSTITLQIVNRPPLGAIFVDGKLIGVGTAKYVATEPEICAITWGDVDGYRVPQPVKVYLNPIYSDAPTVIEGVYQRPEDKPDEVKLTVFVYITHDDQTGVPNALPRARVLLSDGQEAVADASGKAEFRVKAGSGPLTIRALHPEVWAVEQETEVNIGDRDLLANVDFGIAFGGELGAEHTVHEELGEDQDVHHDD